MVVEPKKHNKKTIVVSVFSIYGCATELSAKMNFFTPFKIMFILSWYYAVFSRAIGADEDNAIFVRIQENEEFIQKKLSL